MELTCLFPLLFFLCLADGVNSWKNNKKSVVHGAKQANLA